MLEIPYVCAFKISGLCNFGTAEDLTAQFTLDCSLCCVLKADARFVYSFNAVNIKQHGYLVEDFLLEFAELFQ